MTADHKTSSRQAPEKQAHGAARPGLEDAKPASAEAKDGEAVDWDSESEIESHMDGESSPDLDKVKNHKIVQDQGLSAQRSAQGGDDVRTSTEQRAHKSFATPGTEKRRR